MENRLELQVIEKVTLVRLSSMNEPPNYVAYVA